MRWTDTPRTFPSDGRCGGCGAGPRGDIGRGSSEASSGHYHRRVRDRRRRPGDRRLRALGAGVVLVVSFALAACGGDEPSSGDVPTSPSSGAVLPGGGLSVAEAVATDAEPPLAVSGWLVRAEAGARICSSYAADADQPCGEPSLALEGDVEGETGEEVSLLGSVDGGTFVVSPTVQG